jgi:hypothetical protein
MNRLTCLLLGAWLCVAPASPAAASDAAVFRVFLTDGGEVASYGEFARLEDSVIVTLPAGGTPDSPRLHVVTLPAALVDWDRTDRYAASVRYQRYAATRGEEDFERLSDEVASVLNEIAFSTDRPRALALAEQARVTMAGWPIANFGYRHHDVREIVRVLDEAINTLRGATASGVFELSFVATVPPVVLEPIRSLPSLAGQLDQLLLVAAVAPRASDRLALLQSALTLLDESAASLPGVDVRGLRRSIDRQIRDEHAVDTRYARLASRMLQDAQRAAAAARVSDVERVLDRLPREDARLGGRRPEVVQALQASVQVQLDQARGLRLLRDQWELRRRQTRDYQRMVGSQLVVLVQTEPWLDAIRRLDGPSPDTLLTLRTRLAGGADRLERLLVPEELRPVHDLFIGAWRLAQNAVNVRYEAVAAANVDAAWSASSAAAGALMLLGRAQEGLAALVEPPTLQDVAP